MKVTFDAIYHVLVQGLIKEGQHESEYKMTKIKAALREVEQKTHEQSSNERLIELQVCCAKLYTEHCYIFATVNTALRDNDRTKLFSLGPYCYLLFKHVARSFKSKPKMRERLQRVFRPREIHSMTLYRGDRASEKTLEEYQKAAGDSSKHFKWLPFVSTSRDRREAEKFSHGVLYIIEMRSYSSNEDRFTDLAPISEYTHEQEVLLLPGVQFQINKFEYDKEKNLNLVYIKVNSTYISKLQ